jgi:hypothetical protein
MNFGFRGLIYKLMHLTTEKILTALEKFLIFLQEYKPILGECVGKYLSLAEIPGIARD